MAFDSDPSTPSARHEGSDEASPGVTPTLAPLPLAARLTFLTVGWVLLAVGIAGLVLPGIQGILTIGVALAILSLASATVYRFLDRRLRRWPRAHRRMEALRARLHGWATRTRR